MKYVVSCLLHVLVSILLGIIIFLIGRINHERHVMCHITVFFININISKYMFPMNLYKLSFYIYIYILYVYISTGYILELPVKSCWTVLLAVRKFKGVNTLSLSSGWFCNIQLLAHTLFDVKRPPQFHANLTLSISKNRINHIWFI